MFDLGSEVATERRAPTPLPSLRRTRRTRRPRPRARPVYLSGLWRSAIDSLALLPTRRRLGVAKSASDSKSEEGRGKNAGSAGALRYVRIAADSFDVRCSMFDLGSEVAGGQGGHGGSVLGQTWSSRNAQDSRSARLRLGSDWASVTSVAKSVFRLNVRRRSASFSALVTRSFWEVHSLQFKSARAPGDSPGALTVSWDPTSSVRIRIYPPGRRDQPARHAPRHPHR